MLTNNILWTIGKTPIVKINRMNRNAGVGLYAKLKGCNPTGSVKDRIALKRIEEAEITGELTKGKNILEATSGTLMGVGMGLREKKRLIKTVEAQPVRGHYIQGLKSMIVVIFPDRGEKYLSTNLFHT